MTTRTLASSIMSGAPDKVLSLRYVTFVRDSALNDKTVC